MKPIKYAKSVCLTIVYAAIVSIVFFGICKLSGNDITIEGYTLMMAYSAILLHFMHEENKEDEDD